MKGMSYGPARGVEQEAPASHRRTPVHYERKDGIETIWLAKSGPRMVHGIGSTGTVNSHGYSLNPLGCKVKFPIPLLASHGFKGKTRDPASDDLEAMRIGEVVFIRKHAAGIYYRAILDDSLAANRAWEGVVSGRLRAASTAANTSSLKMKGVVDGVVFYDQWQILEVSICDKGANGDATCEVYEGVGG